MTTRKSRKKEIEAEEGVWPLPPRHNADLVGQEEAERTLLAAWRSGRLPHAWLICGPRGVGKATLAYRFARAVLASGGAGDGLFTGEGSRIPPDLALAPEHPIFRRVAARGHGDLLAFERELNDKGKLESAIPAERIRSASELFHMTAAEGGWRIAIVDSVDDLNTHGANALLKVLEEPSERSLLLLVCHEPGRLLDTIRSRCRRLNLKPLGDATLATLIQQHAGKLPDEDVMALLALSDGSIGRALDLVANGGLALYRELFGVLSGFPHLDTAAVHAFADRLARDRDGLAFRVGMELLLWWLGRLLRAASGHEPDGELIAGEADLIERCLGSRNLAHWLTLWDKTAGLLRRGEGIHLDRKQMAVAALLSLEADVP
ncbi:MAG: DNA polymerase III subunit delta' [Kiloniellales bacterium]